MRKKGKIKIVADSTPEIVVKSTDTLILPAVSKDTVVAFQKTLFQNHLLRPQHQKAQYSERFNPDWLTITLIAIVMLFTWFKLIYHRMFLLLTNAFFSMATTNQVVRDESVLLQRASLNSSVIAYLVGGLFLYQISITGNWQNELLLTGLLRFIMFALVIAVSYTIKMIVLWLLSNIFQSERPAYTYIFTIFLFNMIAGLLLLPVVILTAYAPAEYREILIKAGLVILGIIFLYRMVRIFIIWTSQLRASLFYLFLYLCAFEIAPLLLIGKIALIQE